MSKNAPGRIEQLEADNARLKEAMERIAAFWPLGKFAHPQTDPAYEMREIARAALGIGGPS